MTSLTDFELYTPEITASILEGYLDLQDDPDFIELKLDILNAIASAEVTGQMRMLIFLKFGIALNVMQTLELMHINYEEYLALLDDTFETLTAITNGTETTSEPFVPPLSKNFQGFLLELQTSHINPLDFNRLEGLLGQLASWGDDLAITAFDRTHSTQPIYVENATGKSIFQVPDQYAVGPHGPQKSTTNDEFYRVDLRHDVFYGDDSLIIADLDAIGNFC